jgi:hypothetical protein
MLSKPLVPVLVVLSLMTGGRAASVLEAHAADISAIDFTCFQPYPETVEQSVQRHFTQAFAVFSGEVRFLTLERATIRVLRVWKGKLGTEVVLATGARDMGNGTVAHVSNSFTLKHGETYLLFGRGDTTDSLRASACDANGLLKESAREIAILDKLVKAPK